MKKILFLLIIVLFFSFFGNASTIKYVCDGNWNSPAIWNKGTIPVSTDTIIISNYVVLDTDVTLTAPGMLIIESTGSLCGSHDFNGEFLTNGPLSVSLLTTQGSCVSNAWVSAEGATTDNWIVNGGGCLSGCAPSCFVPTNNCSPLGVTKIIKSNELNIYPNPTQTNFTIETTYTDKQTLNVFDVNGKLVLSQTINGKTNIDASNLAEGVYNLSLINQNGVANKRLVIVR